MGVTFPDIDLPVGWSAGNDAWGGESVLDQDYFGSAAATASASIIEATRDAASAAASAAGAPAARIATAALAESSQDTAVIQARTHVRATATAADRADTAVSAALLLVHATGSTADSSDAALGQARVMLGAAAAVAEPSVDRAAVAASASTGIGLSVALGEPALDSASATASVMVRAHAAAAEQGDVAVAQAFLAVERVVSAALVESGSDRVAGIVGWPAIDPAADTEAGGLGLAPRRGGTWSVPQPWNGSPLPHAAPIPASVRRRPRADALLLTPL